ncbi:MAG TPA: 5'-3' exonuclease H3TH domain-containing protein [Thermoanaerobaculia bacterium]|nr:5'-3' exonuclease H3TH domain-containing protein [Thermoanaerobaculia bacterium]
MIVHLIDGTYELFRHFYGLRRAKNGDVPFGAVRGVLHMVLEMMEKGATHIGVATDHIIESFRNDLWPGYKTGIGIEPALWAQFHPLEDALAAMGVAVWPMVDLEADDGLASAAALAAADPTVEKVCIWTPDKDLGQCVVGERVVQVDRKSGTIRDAAGVQKKFGVAPASIPDYLALVGDAADGFPGLPGFGAKSAAAVLARFGHIEAIPADASEWRCNVAKSERLASTLIEHREHALLFRTLATLRTDAPLFDEVEQLRWNGPTPGFAAFAERIGAPELITRAAKLLTPNP